MSSWLKRLTEKCVIQKVNMKKREGKVKLFFFFHRNPMIMRKEAESLFFSTYSWPSFSDTMQYTYWNTVDRVESSEPLSFAWRQQHWSGNCASFLLISPEMGKQMIWLSYSSSFTHFLSALVVLSWKPSFETQFILHF